MRLKSNLDSGIPQAIQRMAIEALEGPQDCIPEHNRFTSAAATGWWLRSRSSACLRPPKASLYLWARVPEDDKRAVATRLLDEAGVVVTPGTATAPRARATSACHHHPGRAPGRGRPPDGGSRFRLGAVAAIKPALTAPPGQQGIASDSHLSARSSGPSAQARSMSSPAPSARSSCPSMLRTSRRRALTRRLRLRRRLIANAKAVPTPPAGPSSPALAKDEVRTGTHPRRRRTTGRSGSGRRTTQVVRGAMNTPAAMKASSQGETTIAPAGRARPRPKSRQPPAPPERNAGSGCAAAPCQLVQGVRRDSEGKEEG
jgi:hypothetical protein